MSRHITDDQMRSLWKRRCQAREELASIGLTGKPRSQGFCHRPIRDLTHDERKTMRRCEWTIYWATRDLERGLREAKRKGTFQVTPGEHLTLGSDGHLVPVWEWMWTIGHSKWEEHAASILERREAVAC